MSPGHPFHDHLGEYSGPNQLWLRPGTPSDTSEGRLRLEPGVLHVFWARKGEPKQGRLEIQVEGEVARVSWTDTWHNPEAMLQEGTCTDGRLDVMGHYSAGEETWGWRTVVDFSVPEQLTLLMYNVLPTGEQAEAVRLEGQPV